MLGFCSGGSRHPGLGLKLGFRRWDRDGLHRRGGVIKSDQRLLMGRGRSGGRKAGLAAGRAFSVAALQERSAAGLWGNDGQSAADHRLRASLMKC